MTVSRYIARAKINLTLHVQPVNEHGLHPLHSLVVFSDIGDVLTAKIADEFSLTIGGEFSEDLPLGKDNLVLKAARITALNQSMPVKLSYNLTKNLPVASGIGGGSADAGAAIHLLSEANGSPRLSFGNMLADLGADVPVCYVSQTCIMEGIGEVLTPLPNAGQLAAVLINPAVAVSTAEVFRRFDAVPNGSSKPQKGGANILEMALGGGNDLQDIAIQIEPVIQTVLDAISDQALCQLARMSGSGATCFGIFETMQAAQIAARAIKKNHPNWWCAATLLGDANEL